MPHDDDEVETLLTQGADPFDASDLVFTVDVVRGKDEGTRFAVDPDAASPVLLGTSPVCALRLADAEVSRRHASFAIDKRRLRVCDLGSTNGTFVNDVRVEAALLAGGETVRVGATTLKIERGARAATAARLPDVQGFGRFVGGSAEVRRLFPLCERLANTNVPVIIEGETGTGKEILAEALHEEGARAAGPFVVFDCTQVAPSLVESELFGHERGAFTGAIATRRGVFEQAHGGTLLIDEIGDLDLALQPKLLRALERGEIRRVGGDRFVKVDVRVLAATRRDLDRLVEEGRFRDDLLHRLAVARLELPPLRRRRGDVALLASRFCAELGGDPSQVPAPVLARWEEYAWPGNVRELRNAVARRIALGDLSQEPASRRVAEPATEPDFIDKILARRLPLATAREQVMAELERRYVARTLADHGGNVARAAQASGVARRHFQRLKAKTK
jgi:DNA-binding NtrC family response regulator